MLKSKRFIRKIEDFVCNYCGLEVKGDGYTDHCPHCLYSKHVDNNPGDRKCSCGGLMEPMGVIIKGGKQMIYYRCLKCSYHHRVKISPHDDYNRILELSSNPVKDDFKRNIDK